MGNRMESLNCTKGTFWIQRSAKSSTQPRMLKSSTQPLMLNYMNPLVVSATSCILALVLNAPATSNIPNLTCCGSNGPFFFPL